MAVTLQDIAKACGVSSGTVDRALNNKGRIREDTKQRVLETARRLGYQPNLVARSLVRGQSMCIGVIVMDILNHYFAQIVNAASLEARKHGYVIDVMLHETEPDKEYRVIDELVARRVDGLIMCPANDSKDFLNYVQKLPVPVITVGTPLLNVPNISIDEYTAAQEATALICGKGYERVMLICPNLMFCDFSNELSQDAHRRRLQGFLDVVQSRERIEYATCGDSSYMEAAREFLDSGDGKRTAFLCSGDIYALEILRSMNSLGKRAPEDFGIMGFDNIDFLRYMHPALTTVDIPVEQYGTLAVRNLLQQIRREEFSQKTVLKHTLIENGTL